jgi:hypothetical protein
MSYLPANDWLVALIFDSLRRCHRVTSTDRLSSCGAPAQTRMAVRRLSPLV